MLSTNFRADRVWKQTVVEKKDGGPDAGKGNERSEKQKAGESSH